MARSHFQFSIRWILGLTASIAACVGLWVADTTWWLGIVVLATNLVLPPICWIVCLAVTGHARAFWLGVSFSTTIAVGAFFINLHFMSHGANVAGINFIGVMNFLLLSAATRHPTLGIWLFAPLVGLLCAVFHWFMEHGNAPVA